MKTEIVKHDANVHIDAASTHTAERQDKSAYFLLTGTNFRKSYVMLQVMEEGCWPELLTEYLNDRKNWDQCSYKGTQLYCVFKTKNNLGSEIVKMFCCGI